MAIYELYPVPPSGYPVATLNRIAACDGKFAYTRSPIDHIGMAELAPEEGYSGRMTEVALPAVPGGPINRFNAQDIIFDGRYLWVSGMGSGAVVRLTARLGGGLFYRSVNGDTAFHSARISLDGRGQPWVTCSRRMAPRLGTVHNGVAQLRPRDGKAVLYILGWSFVTPRRILHDPEGGVWFSVVNAGPSARGFSVGHLDPARGIVRAFTIGSDANPGYIDMAADWARGMLWITENPSPNGSSALHLVKLDALTVETFSSGQVPGLRDVVLHDHRPWIADWDGYLDLLAGDGVSNALSVDTVEVVDVIEEALDSKPFTPARAVRHETTAVRAQTPELRTPPFAQWRIGAASSLVQSVLVDQGAVHFVDRRTESIGRFIS